VKLNTKIIDNREPHTRDTILRSAERLFAEKGFELTTVREIAQDSGVNVAMIYYYFKTKEGLHQEIIEESFSHLYHSLTEGIDEGKGPEEKIHDVIKVYVEFLYSHKDLHRIILRETVSQSGHIEMIVKKYVSKNFNLVHGVIEEGAKSGVFKKQDTALSTFSLVGMILYYFTYEPIFTRLISSGKMEKPVTEYLPEHIFNLFMEGVKG
jgi:TetR/AcrR family transcriptional regulator